MLTPTTVGGLKLSLKCVMRWALHHQCPGYVVVSGTEQAYQPASNPSEYFRRTITVLILDHLLSELDKQFSSHQNSAFVGLYLVPSVLVTEDLASVSSVTRISSSTLISKPLLLFPEPSQ